MKRKAFPLVAWLVFFAVASASASEYKLVNGQKDFYYGHISYAEVKNDGQDPMVFREGRITPEIAILNLPLGPGDVIQTSGERRTEVQFDNGTTLRLDLNSRLKIETILAQSLSTAKKISNLVLERGQLYVMYKKYSGLEVFQVVAPGAAVKFDHNSVALIRLTEDGKTDVQVERGKAFLLYGADKTHLSQKRLNAGQRGIVSAGHQAELAEYVVLSDFKAWNESMNSHFQELHEGNLLPQPVRNLPKAVFEFAQKFGNMHGEWLWHDLYGYVWRPYLNDRRYPWGTWQPYINGSWSSYDGEMFWVPAEPWGWVPYHLGIWMWDKSKGWVWLPGSMFAPAWAVWEFYHGMYAWRPFYLYDWMGGFDSFWGSSFWAGYYGPGIPRGQNAPSPQSPQEVIDSIRKDQLKKNDSPSLPMPKEMKKAFGATLAALKRGDQVLLSSVAGLPQYTVIIKKQDFLSPQWQDKVISFERLAKETQAAPQAARPASSRLSPDASRDALLTIERSRAIADLKTQVAIGPGHPRTTAPSAFRFRDWNPDVRAAIRVGVEIFYSSRTNEVACPQLGLSSRRISPARQTMMGGQAAFAPSSGSQSSSGNTAATGQTSRSSGQPRSSGSSGSQKQKN
ncbi:MAG: DUF6600 domain-containing protein [Candidatus Aminicenantales bacterium]